MELKGVPILASYAALQKLKGMLSAIREAYGIGCPIFIDSGAFSVKMSGRVIDLNDYCSWLEANPWITNYMQLDVIGNEEESFKNLVKMREHGLDPVAVLVYSAPIERVSELVPSGEGWLCVAGGAKRAGSGGDKWYRNRLLSIKARYPKIKLHALGYTRTLPEIITCAADSTDSASMSLATAWGNVRLFDERTFKIYRVETGRKLTKEQITPRFAALMLKYDLAVEDLSLAKIAKRNGKVWMANARSWCRFALHAAKHDKLVYTALIAEMDVRVTLEAQKGIITKEEPARRK